MGTVYQPAQEPHRHSLRQTPFYKDLLEQRPNAIEELADQLTKGIDNLDDKLKPKTAADLANIPINDEELNILFYKMLLGAPYKDILKNINCLLWRQPKEEADTDEDSRELKGEAEEFNSPEGYYSLLDFITLRPSNKIRLYLAPKDLLLSIFHDPEVVNQIIEERKQLYKLAVDTKDAKSSMP